MRYQSQLGIMPMNDDQLLTLERSKIYLVKRSIGKTVSFDSSSLPECFLESLSQSQRTVLGGMMVVNMKIALAVEGH